MLTIELTRVIERPSATLGVLVMPGYEFPTLELPWLDNRPKVSCVPPGKYLVQRQKSDKFNRELFELLHVPGRKEIKFHNGNIPPHTEGCILPGLRFGRLEGYPAVLQSGRALDLMMAELDGLNEFELIIKGV